MITTVEGQVLLQSKLNRPRVTADLVHRPRLKEALDHGLDCPLILVVAPAGFGKSMLVSEWLKNGDLPYAWLSLDESDNDLGIFLTYFVSAIRTLFPDALPETHAFVTGGTLPAVGVIAQILIHELDALEHDIILALDDFHLIREQSIHELLSLVLWHPPQGMHLVIATRLDPSLSLETLRARGQVGEIEARSCVSPWLRSPSLWSGRWECLWPMMRCPCWQRKRKGGPPGYGWQFCHSSTAEMPKANSRGCMPITATCSTTC